MAADYITLIGADNVATAGRQMMGAAETMRHVADNIDGSLERHHRFMDDWLMRFELALEKLQRPNNA